MKIVSNKNTGSKTLKGLTIVLGATASAVVANATTNTAHASTVKAKDTISLKDLAKEKHVDVTDLAKENKVSENHIVEKGDKIKLPTKYTVKQGDTVSEIAQRLGIKTQKLLDANNMSWNNATILVGDKLKLPSTEDKKQVQTTQTQDVQAQQTTTAQAPNSSSIVQNAIQLAHENIPYVWGGTSLSGFDCSGLVQYLENQAGVNVGRTTYEQAGNSQIKSVSEAKPGDLLFWGGSPSSAYHVAVYIGNGQYVHAPQPGQNVTIGSIASFAPSFAGTPR